MCFYPRTIASDLSKQQDELNNKRNEAAKMTQDRDKLKEKLSSLERQCDMLNVRSLQKSQRRKTFRIWRSRSSGSRRNSLICSKREVAAAPILELCNLR